MAKENISEDAKVNNTSVDESEFEAEAVRVGSAIADAAESVGTDSDYADTVESTDGGEFNPDETYDFEARQAMYEGVSYSDAFIGGNANGAPVEEAAAEVAEAVLTKMEADADADAMAGSSEIPAAYADDVVAAVNGVTDEEVVGATGADSNVNANSGVEAGTNAEGASSDEVYRLEDDANLSKNRRRARARMAKKAQKAQRNEAKKAQKVQRNEQRAQKEKEKADARIQKRRGKKRRRRRGKLSYATIAILVAIALVVGASVKNIVSLKIENVRLQKQHDELIRKRDNLKLELERVNSKEYIEQQARRHLRLVNPDEILFIYPDDDDTETTEDTE